MTTHAEARDALEALALDALDAPERDAVLAHVAGCEECRAELARLEAEAGVLVHSTVAVPMEPAQRDRVRARLMARAAADRAGAPALTVSRGAAAGTSTAPPVIDRTARPMRTIRGAGWLAAAASIIAVASLAGLLRMKQERDTLRSSLATLSADRGSSAVALDSLRAAVEERDRMIAGLTGADVAVMSLASTDPRSPSARMFWDRAHDGWTFVAHHLPAPRPGRTYQLWLVTPTAKISAGTFTPRENGEAIVRATYALPRNALAAVAVTDEPGTGSTQPTTTPFLVAAKGE